MPALGVCPSGWLCVFLCSVALPACGSPPDTSLYDAGTSERDAADDVGVHDAGCTARVGELEGERSVESGALPALRWASAAGEVALVDHHVPCAPPGQLVVLRQLAAWSAPSLWHAAHTAELAAIDDVVVIDLWAADETALPMRPQALAPLEALYDVTPDAIVADPDEQLGVVAFGGIALPIVLVLDARSLTTTHTLTDPRAGEVEHAVRAAQARLRREPAPESPMSTLIDGRFTRDRWELIEAMGAPYTPGPSPSNRHAEDPAAAALGARLFDDASLSPHAVSCRTCHDPARAFTDGVPRGRGVAEVRRNTPTLLGAAGTEWPFWDGRTDSLWAQALAPIEHPSEMGSSRLFVAHRIAGAYRAEYEAIFGPLPPLEDATRFPAAGGPGEGEGGAAWAAMTEADRDAVTRVLVNVGKAIEAHERTLSWSPGRLDAYARGALDALSEREREGLLLFFVVGCVQCHSGPRLANDGFFAIDMPGVGEGVLGDQGRIEAFSLLSESEFRRGGVYGDSPDADDPLATLTGFPERTRGAFRTPTLRALRDTAPYGHAGTFTTLQQVVEHYGRVRRPHTPDPRVIGVLDRHLIGFEDSRAASLVAFLEAL